MPGRRNAARSEESDVTVRVFVCVWVFSLTAVATIDKKRRITQKVRDSLYSSLARGIRVET